LPPSSMVMVSAVPPDPVTDTMVMFGGFAVVLDGAVGGAWVCGVVAVGCGGPLAVCDPHPATASASEANAQIVAAGCLMSEP
jgi:hypothetical protein